MNTELKKEYIEMNAINMNNAIHEELLNIFVGNGSDVKKGSTIMGMSEGNLRNILCGNKPFKLNGLFLLAKNLDTTPWELGSKFVYDRYDGFNGNGYYTAPVVIVMNDEHANKKHSEEETFELLTDYSDIHYAMSLGDESDKNTVVKFDMDTSDKILKATVVLKKRYEEQWNMFLDRFEKMNVIDPKTFNKTMTEIFYELKNENPQLQQYILTMVCETKKITKRKRKNI